MVKSKKKNEKPSINNSMKVLCLMYINIYRNNSRSKNWLLPFMGNCNVLDKNMESSCICVYLSIQFGVGCRILGSMNLKIENCLAHACAEKVQLSYHQSNPTDKKNRFCESKLPDHHLLISEPHPAKVKTVQFEIKAVSTKDRLLYIMFIMSKSCHACKYTGLRRIR